MRFLGRRSDIAFGACSYAGLLLRDKIRLVFSLHVVLNYPWVARIGVYSYAMYLIHHIVINVIEKNAPWLGTTKPLLVLVTFAIATLYASILDISVDSYFRRLRKKFS